MFRYNAGAFVEFAAELANGFGILGDAFLTPAKRNRPQERDERGGCGEDHSLFDSGFDQGRVALERGAKKGFAGKEKYDEFGGGRKLFPVGFCGQLCDMCALAARVRATA